MASDSDASDHSDLDDVPLFLRDEAPTPRGPPKPALGLGLGGPGRGEPSSSAPAPPVMKGLNLGAASSAPEAPPPSSRGPPPPKLGLSLNKIPNLATPDPSEPMPSSRGGPRLEAPVKLALPLKGVAPIAEDGMLERTTSEASTSVALPPAPTPRVVSAPPPADSQQQPAPSTSNSGAGPLTSRVHKPPRLMLADPATASPVPSPAMMAGVSLQAPAATDLASANDRVVVSLLSSAFTVNRASSLGGAPPPSTSGGGSAGALVPQTPTAGAIRDVVAQRCAKGLGIAVEDLRFFELKEIPAGLDVSDSTRHVAVLINQSGFSLPALEEMLVQNQQLQSTQQTNAQTISTMHADFKAATSENTRLAVKCAEQDKDLDALREKVKAQATEIENLRAALQRCDEQRHQLSNTITTLKNEFTAMMVQASGGQAR